MGGGGGAGGGGGEGIYFFLFRSGLMFRKEKPKSRALPSLYKMAENLSDSSILINMLKKSKYVVLTPFVTILWDWPAVKWTLVISTSLISNNWLYRLRLSRITAYLEEKIPSLFKHENVTTGNKVLWKEKKLLLRSNFSSFPQYFQYISNFRSKIT